MPRESTRTKGSDRDDSDIEEQEIQVNPQANISYDSDLEELAEGTDEESGPREHEDDLRGYSTSFYKFGESKARKATVDTHPLYEQVRKYKLKLRLPELTSDKAHDFKRWKRRFKNKLTIYDLEDILKIGTLDEALIRAGTQKEFKFTEWKALSKKLYALIVDCLPDRLVDIIATRANKDGVKAWKELSNHIRSRSQFRRAQLTRTLNNVNLRPNQNPAEFYTFLNNIMSELEYTGASYSEDDKINLLLSKLTKDYEQFITLFSFLPERERTLSRLEDRLKEEYEKRKYRSANKPRRNRFREESNAVDNKSCGRE